MRSTCSRASARSRSSSRCCAPSPAMHGFRAEFDKALPLGYEILSLADAQDSETMRVDGHLMVAHRPGVHDRHRGRPASTSSKASSASSRSATARIASRSARTRASHTYTTAALILWLRGFPDRGLEPCAPRRRPCDRAAASHHDGLRASTTPASCTCSVRSPSRCASARSGVLDVADEYELPIWKALGTVLLGVAKTDLGHLDEGLARDRRRHRAVPGTAEPARVLAAAALRPRPRLLRAPAGRRRASSSSTSRSLASPAGPGPLPPLFFSMKGDLLLRPPGAGCGRRGACFQQGYDVAAELGVRSGAAARRDRPVPVREPVQHGRERRARAM